MYTKLIWRHRIITPIFNFTLDYFLVRFTLQPLHPIKGYVSFEWECHADKPRLFLVFYATASLSFSWQTRLAVISSLYWQINITWNEASFTLPSVAQERQVKASFVAEFSCCVPRSKTQCHKLICDTGFSWFPCVYKRMLRWFPSFQVATTCLSCSPPDLIFSSSYLCTCKITTATGWQPNCNE